MKRVIQWIKTNLIIVLSVIVILLAIGSLFLANLFGAGFREDLEQRQRDLRQVKGFLDKQVQIPSEDPTEGPRSISIVVNQAAVTQLEQVFNRMDESYRDLQQAAATFNQLGPLNPEGDRMNVHEPMLENLFPRPANPARQFQAVTEYREAFRRMYERLGAGMPPTAEEVAGALERAESGRTAAGIESAEQERARLQAQTRLQLLMRRARQIQLYAEPTTFTGQTLSPGSFDVSQWAVEGTRPSMDELWAGQMQLWIQQDIVNAIRLANETGDGQSVLGNPVKRLLSIRVVPGYLGIEDGRGGGGDDLMGGYTGAGGVSAPEPGPQLPRNFVLNPTGRISNSLYDVRMAEVSLIVDSQQIPRLFNALTQLNFITPIVQGIHRVDQAAALEAGGFVYGNNVDVVQLDLQLESLWLRSWTAGHATRDEVPAGETFNPGLMPDPVRYRLGLETRQPYTPTGERPERGQPRRGGGTPTPSPYSPGEYGQPQGY